MIKQGQYRSRPRVYYVDITLKFIHIALICSYMFNTCEWRITFGIAYCTSCTYEL